MVRDAASLCVFVSDLRFYLIFLGSFPFLLNFEHTISTQKFPSCSRLAHCADGFGQESKGPPHF
jgi:hypothetical protein